MYMNVQEPYTEQETLDQALQAVRHATGLHLTMLETGTAPKDLGPDALIQLEDGQQLAVEVKKWAQQANLGALVNQIKHLPATGLLAADYVNPNMADRLRHEGVQFIDTAGNAFINMPPIYVYVTGRRKQKAQFTPGLDGAKRAFEPTGLKVIYLFLCDPDMVNAPYREIAEQTGVAVGTVTWVIKGLKAGNFIRDQGPNRKRRLINRKKLLDRWVEVYPEKLRPKLLLGEFTAENPFWWKEIDINKYDGYWGGEIAGTKYTEYLKPQVVTLYLHDKTLTQLITDTRLRKATQWLGENPAAVVIYKPFWPDKAHQLELVITGRLVHPVLAYADLIATGDSRNIETAERIYDEHIAKYIRED
jgi:hypothetical protein